MSFFFFIVIIIGQGSRRYAIDVRPLKQFHEKIGLLDTKNFYNICVL